MRIVSLTPRVLDWSNPEVCTAPVADGILRVVRA